MSPCVLEGSLLEEQLGQLAREPKGSTRLYLSAARIASAGHQLSLYLLALERRALYSQGKGFIDCAVSPALSSLIDHQTLSSILVLKGILLDSYWAALGRGSFFSL